MEKARRLEKIDESSLATTLAGELATALRAAGRASAAAWGTRALWGGVFLGALARSLGANANASETVALISLISAFIVGVAAWRKKTGAAPTGTRARAMLAARRLERRFPEQTGVWSAGVDFCCEKEAENARTSADLRDATIRLAARRLAAVASETDVGNWRAILTEENGELFRNPRKKVVVCVLGVLINLALWGSSAVCDGCVNGKRGAVSLAGEEISANDARVDENRQSGESKEKKGNEEDKRTASVGENSGNNETGDVEIGAASPVDEQPLVDGDFLSALEVLISDLAQNAEIAEVLETELDNAAVDERTNEEKNEGSDVATRFLFLARELNANLTRPKTGILAQVRRLEATLRREQTTILERLEKINKTNGIGGIEGNVKIRGIEGISGIGDEKNGLDGAEVALFLLTSRLKVFEAKICVAETQEIASTLGLSVVLRSDSAAERAKTLEAAARRAGEWATILRRETTAAQILRESWLFDATSQSWKEASETAWQKNQTLLARFAGRSPREVATFHVDDVAFEKAKERFVDAWRNARSLEKERFAIVERLMKRLQTEEAREFGESVGAKNDLGIDGNWVRNDEWDAAAWAAINDAASNNDKRDLRITEALENNRFGIVAEELQTQEKRLKIKTPTIEKTISENEENDGERETVAGVVSDDKKEVKKEGRSGEKEIDERREERRRAFLAARLTFGVDGETLGQTELQNVVKQEVGVNNSAVDESAAPRRASEKRKQSDLTARQEEETRIAETTEEGDDATSFESAKERTSDNDFTEGEVTDGKISGYGGKEYAEKTREQTNEEAPSRVVDNESRSEGEANVAGSTSGGGSGAVLENAVGTQVDENQSFNGELPPEVRRRFEGTRAPEITPEYAEKIRLYRRRIADERR